MCSKQKKPSLMFRGARCLVAQEGKHELCKKRKRSFSIQLPFKTTSDLLVLSFLGCSYRVHILYPAPCQVAEDTATNFSQTCTELCCRSFPQFMAVKNSFAAKQQLRGGKVQNFFQLLQDYFMQKTLSSLSHSLFFNSLASSLEAGLLKLLVIPLSFIVCSSQGQTTCSSFFLRRVLEVTIRLFLVY